MESEQGLRELLEELAKVRGLDFRGYKTGSLQRRLRKRMEEVGVNSFSDYHRYFLENPEEVSSLLHVILINITEFFRDPLAWAALRNEALKPVLDRLKRGDTFRAWSAGCSTGEEVYSLAILLSECLGPRINGIDVKIYATDYDENALNIARRGEYSPDRLRRISAESQEKYFTIANGVARVNRDVRRMAIFGRSNLVTDAPISHVHLIICRNVLIYFDLPLQHRVLEKFRYAMEQGGTLFLGKAESQLSASSVFHAVNSKWRIFRYAEQGSEVVREGVMVEKNREFEQQKVLQQSLLETLRAGVVIMDPQGVILSVNEAAQELLKVSQGQLAGKNIQETALLGNCPELRQALQQVAEGKEQLVRFQCSVPATGGEKRSLELILRSVIDNGTHVYTVLYCENITTQEKLRSTIEELETTAEELHSANEELETTNEELQSTNEELETTNEELQSTNEELETTNEELQSTNEELESTNDELERRTRDLEEVSTRFAETVAMMPMAVAVLGKDDKIQLWNSSAERLFDLDAKGIIGLTLKQLPIPRPLRNLLTRRYQTVLRTKQAVQVRIPALKLNGFHGSVDLRLIPISNNADRGVLIVFDAKQSDKHVREAISQRTVGAERKSPTAGRVAKPPKGRNPGKKASAPAAASKPKVSGKKTKAQSTPSSNSSSGKKSQPRDSRTKPSERKLSGKSAQRGKAVRKSKPVKSKTV